MGDQIKQAFEKIKEFWKNMTPRLKKAAMIGAAAIVLLAVGGAFFLNLSGNSYEVLYAGMDPEEGKQVYAMLQEMEVDVQLNGKGEVMAKKSAANYARAQMALKHYPQSTLPYDIFDSAAGLTTTDFEKRQKLVQQDQNRMQDTIRQFEGVENAIVTLKVAQDSTRVWEVNKAKSTGSVSVWLEPGVSLSKEQVSAIKWLVSSSIGMESKDVQVIDANTLQSLKGSEDGMGVGGDLDFESQIEQRIVDKAMNQLSIVYGPDDVRVSASVVIDYKTMLSEEKTFNPTNVPDDKNNKTGVIGSESIDYTKNSASAAEGVAGEQNNTDIPNYLNQDGTLNQDVINSSTNREYLVSSITQQINDDKAKLKSASVSIALKNPIDDLTMESMLDNISKATGVSTDSISIRNLAVIEAPAPDDKPVIQTEIDTTLLILVGAGVLTLLVLALVLVLILRKRSRKRKEEEVNAEERALEEARMGMQREFEDRKRLLKESAESNNKGDAIANEVRDFAKENPEITATLLRVWLKEDAE